MLIIIFYPQIQRKTLFLISFVFGCSPVKEKTSTPEITTQDIAKALHLQKWSIKIPDDLPEDSQVSLKLTYGEKSRIIANISSTAGEIATVMVWQDSGIGGATYFRTDNGRSGEFGELKATDFKPKSFSTGKNSDHICDIEEILMDGYFKGSDECYRLYTTLRKKEH